MPRNVKVFIFFLIQIRFVNRLNKDFSGSAVNYVLEIRYKSRQYYGILLGDRQLVRC